LAPSEEGDLAFVAVVIAAMEGGVVFRSRPGFQDGILEVPQEGIDHATYSALILVSVPDLAVWRARQAAGPRLRVAGIGRGMGISVRRGNLPHAGDWGRFR
jgi:hypothetical protein